jgi:hypothetical protein
VYENRKEVVIIGELLKLEKYHINALRVNTTSPIVILENA